MSLLKELLESSGDWSTDQHAMAGAISKNIQKIFGKEISGKITDVSKDSDLRKGIVKFDLQDSQHSSIVYKGTITIELDQKSVNGHYGKR